jgi:hypothetical protein
MDPALILIVTCAVVFGLLPLFFRSNAVYVFFALCAGELLARLTAQDATQFVRSMPATNNLPVFSIVQVALLVIAPLVIIFAFKNTTKPGQLFLFLLPAVASVIVAVMLIVNKMPYDTTQAILQSGLYSAIEPYFAVAVAAGLASSIAYLISIRPKHHAGLRKKHK